MNWNEFFNMGGYAFYVWTSWGLTALIFVILFVQAKLNQAKLKKQLSHQFARAEKYQTKP